MRGPETHKKQSCNILCKQDRQGQATQMPHLKAVHAAEHGDAHLMPTTLRLINHCLILQFFVHAVMWKGCVVLRLSTHWLRDKSLKVRHSRNDVQTLRLPPVSLPRLLVGTSPHQGEMLFIRHRTAYVPYWRLCPDQDCTA